MKIVVLFLLFVCFISVNLFTNDNFDLQDLHHWSITDVDVSNKEYIVTLNDKIMIYGIVIENNNIILPYQESSGRKYNHIETTSPEGRYLIDNIKKAILAFNDGKFISQSVKDKDINFGRVQIRLYEPDMETPPMGFGSLILNNSIRINNFTVLLSRNNLIIRFPVKREAGVSTTQIICLDEDLEKRISQSFINTFLTDLRMSEEEFLDKWGISTRVEEESNDVYITHIEEEGIFLAVELFGKIMVKDFLVQGNDVVIPGYTNSDGEIYYNIEPPFRKTGRAIERIKNEILKFYSTSTFEKGEVQEIEITDLNVNPIQAETGSLRGFAKITLNDAITITNISIREGSKGLWIAWPSRRSGERYLRQVDFSDKNYKEELEQKILAKFLSIDY